MACENYQVSRKRGIDKDCQWGHGAWLPEEERLSESIVTKGM
jgi:hypothetical protein